MTKSCLTKTDALSEGGSLYRSAKLRPLQLIYHTIIGKRPLCVLFVL